ncbi:MAG: ABC transporter permease [Lentisphaeria bacterium]|nr:ABC transporter permease [Candidatus Neomarinimicrobiota bacterium]MCF7841677.1 ABC transporter permease [Lentisphaeria bacterium]
MMLLQHIRQIIRDLRSQKMRTFMTLFGIVWGSVAIILLITVGRGFHKFSSKAAHGIGEGICILWGGRTSMPYKGFPRGKQVGLRLEDVVRLREKIPELRGISPEFSRDVRIRVGRQEYSTGISGVLPVWGDMRNQIPQQGGRFINALDEKNRRRVVFIGNEVERDLFGAGKGLGETMFINSTPFLVIGILQEKIQNASYNSGDGRRIVIPASTYQGIFGARYPNNVIFQARQPEWTETVKNKVYQVMSQTHQFHPADKEALWIWDTTEMDKFFNSFFLGFTLFLGIVGSMTLIVGGIGVSNIMYVVVEERTREIGIKKALGAKKRLILGQYLLETFLIVTLGGTIGFLISGAAVVGANFLPIEKFVGTLTLEPIVAVVTAAILGLIAFIAGFFPARKAARLDPVMAMRK